MSDDRGSWWILRNARARQGSECFINGYLQGEKGRDVEEIVLKTEKK